MLPTNTNSAAETQATTMVPPKVTKSPLQSVVDTKKVMARRRPVLNTSASNTLLETKIASLNEVNLGAREEHKLQMKILKLKKKEQEKLKQEEMRSELLKIQFERETGVKWVTSQDETE